MKDLLITLGLVVICLIANAEGGDAQKHSQLWKITAYCGCS